jgi:HK97 family phage major capsid protein
MDFDWGQINNQRTYVSGNRKTPLFGSEDRTSDVHDTELDVRSYAWNEPLKPARPYQPLPDGIRAQDLSLARILRGKITGDWHGAEMELRVLGEGTGSLGGFFVPDQISAMLIDLARAKSVTQRAGARTIVMTAPQMAIGRVKTDPVGYWRGENQTIPESDPTWDRVLLIAKALGILCRTSLELLADANNLETMVRSQLANAIAAQLDAICLVGDGVAKPLGILSCGNGVHEVSMGTNGAVLTDYDPFSRAVQAILESNGPSEGLAVIHSPRTWGALDRLKETTTGAPLRPPASYARMIELMTQTIPVNLTKGSASTCSTSIVGDWQWLLLGALGPIQIEVSREADTAFSKAQVLIRALLRCDTAIVRPDHFSTVTGIKAG